MRLDGRGLQILTGSGLLMLAPLAWFQYRWIDELAAAGHARTRADVKAAVDRIAGELDRDITRVHTALISGPPVDTFAERIDRLPDPAESLPVARILKVADTPPWTAEIWDTTRKAFAPANAPEWWIERERRTGPIQSAPLAVVGPMRGRPRRLPPFPGSPPPFPDGPPIRPPFDDNDEPEPWILVEFDEAKFRSEYLPRLISRQFGAERLREFAVRIVPTAKPTETVFSMGETAWTAPDAEAPLLRGIIREMPPPPGRGGPRAPFHAEGLWRLQAAHVSGSLEAVAAATRNRNLLVSGVTLLLLAGAFLALANAARRSRELAELQIEFTAGVSHELRSPIAVIASAGDNLASGIIGDAARVREYGAIVRDEATRLNTMVEQVLRFSAIESGRLPLELDALSARGMLAAVEIEMRDMAAREGFSWKIEGSDADVRADANAIHVALRNLAENALKHAASGKWLRFSIQPAEKTVDIVVEDRGPGIPAEDLPRLFEPFCRGADSRRSQRRGSGLGLALVERIVRAHGGAVRAENRHEGGARFVVTLPAYNT